MSELELVERFKRVGFPHETTLRLISVLLWIQVVVEIPDFLKTCLSLDDNLFSIVSKEVEDILGFLLSNNVITNPSSLNVLNLQTLVDDCRSDSISITSLFSDRERICAFVESKYKMLSNGKMRDVSSVEGETSHPDGATNDRSGSSTPSAVEQSHQLTLNPAAQPFVPVISIDGGIEDDRCLYLTFSKGHPLTSPEIVDFFTMVCNSFGGWRQNPQAVKTVYIHKGEDGMALFGKVVFCNTYIPGFILGTQKEIKFVVNGKTLWCKRFVRRNARNNRIDHHQRHQGESSTHHVRGSQSRVGFGGSWYGNNWAGPTVNARLMWPQGVGTTSVVGHHGWPIGQFLQPNDPRLIRHVGVLPQSGVVATHGGVFIGLPPGQVGYYHAIGRALPGTGR